MRISRGIFFLGFLIAGLFVLAPATAWAQASITGVVRDTSGAVSTGCDRRSVEPVAHRKGENGDDRQQRPLPDRRSPGRRLHASPSPWPGFTTVKREGVALEGTFTATINADLRVGALTETITVTGESPIVDVQSIKRQVVLDNETISAIPSSRSYNNLIQLMPNSINQAGAPTDVQVVPGMVVFGGFGGRSNEGRVNIDGISVGSAFNGAGVSSYIADVGNAREIAMTTSGGLGENEGGGPSLEHPAERGRQRAARHVLHHRRQRRHDRQQLQRRPEGSRPVHARRDAQGVGLQPRPRWTDQAGSPLVLLEPARGGERAHGARYVRQQERWRPEQVDGTRPTPAVPRCSPRHYRITALRLTGRPRRATSSSCSGISSVRAKAAPRPATRAARAAPRRATSSMRDRLPRRRRRRRPPSRPRRRATVTTATACRRRSGRRR